MSERAALSDAARVARRLGVLGGSFDPPHQGHLHAARSALAAFELDHVLFVPAARPPHKPERALAGAGERLAMLALLLEREPRMSVWEAELQRGGASYTVDTLLDLRAELAPEVRLFLVIGQDNLGGFPHWREAERIVALAQPIVVHREALARSELAGLSSAARSRIELGILDVAPCAVSSSELRERLARGEYPEDGLPPGLREYLARSGLYRRT